MGRISKVFESKKENLLLLMMVVVPIAIISVLAIVIAPYVLSIIGIPLLMGGMILIPAICIGAFIVLVYKSYCAIKKKK